MKRIRIFLILLAALTGRVNAQEESKEIPYSMNEGTLIGVGTANIKDTYLSPFNYKGWGVRILNERMKTIRAGEGRFSRQQFINVDISSTTNPAENVNDFSGFVDYSLGYHYRMELSPGWRLLAGASGNIMGGFIYNTRNSNNPLSAKIDLDMSLSAILIHQTKIRNYPITIRYQASVPVAGVFFAPPYGASYYEIFNVGNTSGIVRFNSFHNKFAMKNYLTVDFPVRSFTLRAGFLNSLYYSDSNGIETHIITNSFMVGWVKEFISIGGKRKKQTPSYHSSFYGDN